MAIVTALAIETDIAIMTVLAIEIDIHGYCDRPNYQNQHGYCNCIGLKTDIYLSGIEPGIKCKEFVQK